MADSTTADIEAQLQDLGRQADAGEVDADTATLPSTNTQQRAAATADTEEKPFVEQDGEQQGKPTTEPEPVKDGEEKPKPDPLESKESKYTKAQKEAARLDKTWQAVNAEKERQETAKAELATARAEIETQRQTFEAERAKALPVLKQGERLKDDKGFTADQYEAYSRDVLLNEDMTPDERKRQSEASYAKAGELRQAEAEASFRGEQEQLRETWNGNMVAYAKANPALKLDDESQPLAKAVTALINSEPSFLVFADGFQKAVQVAQWKVAADSVAGLQADNETLKKENARLNAAMGITAGNPTEPAKAKTLKDMTPAEQEAYMVDLAERADGITA